MKPPSPALVSQQAVRRLPRRVLWGLCLLYILPGFIGRDPWRNADLASFGVMLDLATQPGHWLEPQLLGQAASSAGWLPYWLGAAAIHALPALPAHQAALLPFMALLGLTLVSTWYAAWHLARLPAAQPVAFAFGGEAQPGAYARAVADSALLALLACLGLALLAHQSSVEAARLAWVALALWACARSLHPQLKPGTSMALWGLALFGLALSGAPGLVLLLWLGSELARALAQRPGRVGAHFNPEPAQTAVPPAPLLRPVFAVLALAAASLAWAIGWPGGWFDAAAFWQHWQTEQAWSGWGRLLLWFTWPAALLALWCVWQWRRQWRSPHLLLPLLWLAALLLTAILQRGSERALLLALPCLALLAAFSLPTLKRSVAALIDWFAILFFSVAALTIWIIWLAMMTGIPAEPAENVAKLAPHFVPAFSWLLFVPALAASLGWLGVIVWRARHHPSALWKGLVLSASGITLCWLLLLTLWLPLLNHGLGLGPVSQRVAAWVPEQDCVLVHGLSHEQIAALQYHGGLRVQRIGVRQAAHAPQCARLVVDQAAYSSLAQALDLTQWRLLSQEPRLRPNRDVWLVFERLPGADPGMAPTPARR